VYLLLMVFCGSLGASLGGWGGLVGMSVGGYVFVFFLRFFFVGGDANFFFFFFFIFFFLFFSPEIYPPSQRTELISFPLLRPYGNVPPPPKLLLLRILDFGLTLFLAKRLQKYPP